MVSDPAGYFVIYVDRDRGLLSLEHYLNDGLLDTVIEGNSAAEVYTPAIDRGLISRLDHAAYLGRELARAEESLHSGEPFVQDAAPELAAPFTLASVACGPACRMPGPEGPEKQPVGCSLQAKSLSSKEQINAKMSQALHRCFYYRPGSRFFLQPRRPCRRGCCNTPGYSGRR